MEERVKVENRVIVHLRNNKGVNENNDNGADRHTHRDLRTYGGGQSDTGNTGREGSTENVRENIPFNAERNKILCILLT